MTSRVRALAGPGALCRVPQSFAAAEALARCARRRCAALLLRRSAACCMGVRHCNLRVLLCDHSP